MKTLVAKAITKEFASPKKHTLLKGIDLEINQSQTLAILGPSGIGKSTLLHILGTLEKPSSGTLEICSQKISTKNKSLIRNRHIGFIFQSFHLLEDYTVIDNVLMPAKIAHRKCHKGSQAYQRAEFLLQEVDLLSFAEQHTKFLSGGEKQKVALARALMNDPDLILADEPSGNLDQINSKKIHELLINAAKKFGKSLIVVTHNRELAELCDQQYTLKNGIFQ